MRPKGDEAVLGGGDRCEACEVERLHIRRMKGAVDRPFEPGHAREIGKRAGRREAREEFGEPFAIGIKIGPARRLCRNEDAGAQRRRGGGSPDTRAAAQSQR